MLLVADLDGCIDVMTYWSPVFYHRSHHVSWCNVYRCNHLVIMWHVFISVLSDCMRQWPSQRRSRGLWSAASWSCRKTWRSRPTLSTLTRSSAPSTGRPLSYITSERSTYTKYYFQNAVVLKFSLKYVCRFSSLLYGLNILFHIVFPLFKVFSLRAVWFCVFSAVW